jgi:NAD(P)-dependent dehydrogenase (short-subunit alcohol dehydrogenase family)
MILPDTLPRLGDVFRQRAHAEGKSVESVVDELREKVCISIPVPANEKYLQHFVLLNVQRDVCGGPCFPQIPARRIGKPEDLANVIAFLATPAASYVNGINVPVDGGLLPCL